MPALVETMAYRGQAPWHGLGTELKGNLDAIEVMRQAGLNWGVTKEQISTLDGQIADKWFLLRRDSDKTLLDMVGPEYIPVQNKRVFEFFDSFCRSGDLTLETAGALDNGRRVWALARTNHEYNIGHKDDILRDYLLLYNPYIYGQSMRILYTNIRVVCHNTIVQALSSSVDYDAFRMIHSNSFVDDNIFELARKTVASALGKSEVMKKKFEVLADSKVQSELVMDNFLNQAITGQKELDYMNIPRPVLHIKSIMNTIPGSLFGYGTWWGVFNAVTYYFDHLYGQTQSNRLTSAWFGQTASKKEKALDLALKYAEA